MSVLCALLQSKFSFELSHHTSSTLALYLRALCPTAFRHDKSDRACDLLQKVGPNAADLSAALEALVNVACDRPEAPNVAIVLSTGQCNSSFHDCHSGEMYRWMEAIHTQYPIRYVGGLGGNGKTRTGRSFPVAFNISMSRLHKLAVVATDSW